MTVMPMSMAMPMPMTIAPMSMTIPMPMTITPMSMTIAIPIPVPTTITVSWGCTRVGRIGYPPPILQLRNTAPEYGGGGSWGYATGS